MGVYVRYLDSSAVIPITHVADGAEPTGWTSAGKIVFQSRKAPAGLWTISPVGGEPEPLLEGTRKGPQPRVTAALSRGIAGVTMACSACFR